MTKPSKLHQPVSTIDFTTELFYRVDDTLLEEQKPSLAHLHPREVDLRLALRLARSGLLRLLPLGAKGDESSLSPLARAVAPVPFAAQAPLSVRTLLAKATALGVCDTLGIELLHPMRERRCKWHMARKGKSNHRWIVGAKFFVLLNQWGQIVRWDCCAANVHDTAFHCEIEDSEEKMMVLADTRFHAKEGDPTNLKLRLRGTWNERMLIETAFSLVESILGLKKQDHRIKPHLATRLAYCAAIYNICTKWSGEVNLSLVNFAL